MAMASLKESTRTWPVLWLQESRTKTLVLVCIIGNDGGLRAIHSEKAFKFLWSYPFKKDEKQCGMNNYSKPTFLEKKYSLTSRRRWASNSKSDPGTAERWQWWDERPKLFHTANLGRWSCPARPITCHSGLAIRARRTPQWPHWGSDSALKNETHCNTHFSVP